MSRYKDTYISLAYKIAIAKHFNEKLEELKCFAELVKSSNNTIPVDIINKKTKNSFTITKRKNTVSNLQIRNNKTQKLIVYKHEYDIYLDALSFTDTKIKGRYLGLCLKTYNITEAENNKFGEIVKRKSQNRIRKKLSRFATTTSHKK